MISLYSLPTRHYHSLTHLAACLGEFDRVRNTAEDGPAVELAIWYHDAVYDAKRRDNEERSAYLAQGVMTEAGLSPQRIAAVSALVLDTRHIDVPTTADGRLLADIDLTILGRPAAEFDAYEAQIRKEYAHVSDFDFRQGRMMILRGFLSRPRIYQTPFFFERDEQSARENLRRSLERLARQVDGPA